MTWILDIGFSRSKDTKYFRKIEIYWHTKSMVAQVIEEHGTRHKAILEKLESL
jgi:hypothetical protein